MQERFTRELGALRALAREVGERFPEVGHLVSGRSADPSVERVLQAAALLFARLGEHVEGDLPELTHPFVEANWPELLRPRPALTLVDVGIEGGQGEQPIAVPRGTRVSARVPDGEVSFATTQDTTAWPFVLESVDTSRPDAAALSLTLRFRASRGVDLSALAVEALRLNFVGPARSTLYSWLTRQLVDVRVTSLDGAPVPLPAPLGVAPLVAIDTLPPWPVGLGRYHALAHLEAHFAMPELRAGVAVMGLGQLAGRAASDGAALDDGFALVFRVGDASGREAQPRREDIAVGSVPAANVGLAERIDVQIGDGQTEIPIRGPHGAVFAVERVGAYERRSGEWVEFEPLLRARGSAPKLGQICYEVLRQGGDVRAGDVVVRITDADGRAQTPTADAVTAWVVGLDGPRAATLREGSLTIPGPEAPRQVRFGNSRLIVAEAPSAVTQGRLFERLAVLTASPGALMTTDGLRRLVRAAHPDPGDLPERLVRAVRVARGSHVERRLVRPSTEVVVESDPDVFDNVGDQALFAGVLCAALASDGYLQLELRCGPSVVRVGNARG